jgi:lysozyme
MSYRDTAIEFIKKKEGFSDKAYWDVDAWAIGYGFRDGVKKGQKMSRQEADARMSKETEKYANAVARLVTNPKATEDQKAALTSFAYNAGIGALEQSTLLKKFNAGDVSGASNEFARWSNVRKTEFSHSLYKRRMQEKELFLSGSKVSSTVFVAPSTLGMTGNLTGVLGELRAMNSRLGGSSSGTDWDSTSWTERLRQEGMGV